MRVKRRQALLLATLGLLKISRALAMSQYMKDLGSYIHGNSIWKPTLRY